MTNAVSSALATKTEPHLVERYRADFATVLPSHINADQWVRLARGSFRTNPQLEQILNKNPGSVLRALMDCARLGLVVGDTYHLLPFGNEVTGSPDYTGLIELMYRAGEVTAVKVEIVYEGDHFIYYPGTMDVPDHRPDWFGSGRSERPMIGVYAYAKLQNGSYSQVVIMDQAAVEKVRNVSRTWQKADSMWKKWPDRAWRKTAIRQLAKLVPTDTEYRRAKLQDMRDHGRPEPSPAVLEALGGAIPDVLHDDDIQDAEIVHEPVLAQPVAAELTPEPAADPKAALITKSGKQALVLLFGKLGLHAPESRHKMIEETLGDTVESLDQLTVGQADKVVATLTKISAARRAKVEATEDVPLPTDEPE